MKFVLALLIALPLVVFPLFMAHQDTATTAPVSGPLSPSGVVSEPIPARRVVSVATTAQLQAALSAANRGDTIAVAPGVYSPPAVWPKTKPLFAMLGVTDVWIVGAPGVLIDGQNRVDTLLDISGASDIEVWRIGFTHSRRAALALTNCKNIRAYECTAVDCTTEPNLIFGQFRVIGGGTDNVMFESCWASGGVKGFECREVPTLTAGEASAPPGAGNIGYPADLPESLWPSWSGWPQGVHAVTFRDCVAVNNARNIQHSDGISPRYSRGARVEGCIALWNGDDGIDGIASADLEVADCISGWNGTKFDLSGATGGNGNGVKCGVRGGLRNRVLRVSSIGNANAGVTYADCEQGIGDHILALGSPKSVTTEASRSASKLALLLYSCTLQQQPIAANGAKVQSFGVTLFVPGPQVLPTLRDNVHALCLSPPQAGGVAAWVQNFKTQWAAWTVAMGVPVP